MGADLPRPPIEAHAVWADVALMLAAMLTGLALLRKRVASPRWRLLVAAASYLGWFAVAAAVCRAPIAARAVWVLGIAALVTLYATTAALTVDPRARDTVWRAWIVGACLLGIFGIATGLAAQLGHPIPGLHGGVGELGLSLRPAGLQRHGLLAELALVPFLVVYADGERLLGRQARRVVLGVLSLLLLLGLTRTILGAVVGLALLSRFRRLRSPIVLGAIALLGLAFGLDVHRSGEPGIRWRIAASAFETARTHALAGIGPLGDVAQAAWPGARDQLVGWDAHLTWLDTTARAGLPATIAFAALFVVLLRRMRARSDSLGLALHAALCATLFDSFHVDLEDFRHVWLLFGICASYGDPLTHRGLLTDEGTTSHRT